jgi:hypothetical protein
MEKYNYNDITEIKKTPHNATTDLGNWLNGKLVLYLEDLANPKIGLNLVPNPLVPECCTSTI